MVKCSVTSVWGYELLCTDRSIRVSDCSIRVSRSGNHFYANYALKLLQNSGIILDSFTPSLFLKLFQHNSGIPNDIPFFVELKSSVFLSIIPTCSVCLFSCYCSPLHTNCSTLVITLLEIVFWMHTEGEKMRCDGTVTTGKCTNNHSKSWMVRQASTHGNFNNYSYYYFYYTISLLIRVTPLILIQVTAACYFSDFCSPAYFVVIITIMPIVEFY